MDITLLIFVALMVFALLLSGARTQIAKGANVHVANGAVLLVLASVFGVLVLAMLASLDVW